MAPFELNDEGRRVVSVYQRHATKNAACNCSDCKTVRRAGLVEKPIVRPTCCGKEMKWQGDPVIGPVGYICSSCGGGERGDSPSDVMATQGSDAPPMTIAEVFSLSGDDADVDGWMQR